MLRIQNLGARSTLAPRGLKSPCLECLFPIPGSALAPLCIHPGGGRRSAAEFYVAGRLFSRLTSCPTESEVGFESDRSLPGAEALRHPRWLTHYAFKSRTFSPSCGAEQGCAGGQNIQAPSPNPQKDSNGPARTESTLERIRDLPIVWLIGPYIPATRPFEPLTKAERSEVYFRQTFLTAGSYFARMFAAGIDQARGTPYQWGGGLPGYGRRFGSRYGQFMIASTLHTVGNRALGYESRYHLCRCSGFWPRTRHAAARNFYTYNRTEQRRRPAIPLYAGSYGAGMISNVWLPGRHNTWAEGAYSALFQAGIGSGYNFVSEFAFDVLAKMGGRKKAALP